MSSNFRIRHQSSLPCPLFLGRVYFHVTRSYSTWHFVLLLSPLLKMVLPVFSAPSASQHSSQFWHVSPFPALPARDTSTQRSRSLPPSLTCDSEYNQCLSVHSPSQPLHVFAFRPTHVAQPLYFESTLRSLTTTQLAQHASHSICGSPSFPTRTLLVRPTPSFQLSDVMLLRPVLASTRFWHASPVSFRVSSGQISFKLIMLPTSHLKHQPTWNRHTKVFHEKSCSIRGPKIRF